MPRTFGQKMKLWRIKEPDYDSERQEADNNGSIEFPYGLPGVKCCGTWASCDLLDKECPSTLRKVPELIDGWPVTPERLEEIRSELRRFPGFQDYAITDLPPGMRFLPARFDPPRVHDNDFLWPALEAPVISLRIAALLSRLCPNDFSGVAMPDHSDWILLVFKNRSLPPVERRSDKICQRCGRPNRVSAPTELTVFDEMLPAGDVFLLDTTLHILISDRLKLQLEEIGARNVKYDAVPIKTKPEQDGAGQPATRSVSK